MRRFYYFGCRNGESGHYTWTPHGRHYGGHLEGGFPMHMLDGTFAPLATNDTEWRLTQLRFAHHVVSILACHDNTIDTRPGSNAAFVVIDSAPWDETHILAEARERFPDCWARLHNRHGVAP